MKYQSEIESKPAFARVAWRCAGAVFLGVSLLLSLFGVMGWIIDNRVTLGKSMSDIWSNFLWVIALGGNFWGAIAIGIVLLSFIAWAIAVHTQLAKTDGRRSALIRLILFLVTLWMMTFFAMDSTIASLADLTIYQKIAFGVMSAPWFILLIAFYLHLQEFAAGQK